MKNKIYIIRMTSCGMWFACGVISGGLIGYMSAVASLGFFIAGLLENRNA